MRMIHQTTARGRGLARRLWLVPMVHLAVIGLCGVILAISPVQAADASSDIPNLVGIWSGENHTISNLKGLKTWKKTIEITSQTDRRFRGHFDYSAGRKEFFGVVYPDNISVSWVALDSRGYNHGRLLDGGRRLAACYIESGLDATAGCAELVRKAD